MKWNVEALQWTRQPESYKISQDQIEVVTKPHTDLWQRTYYHFRNDNAPVLQMTTAEKYFSFVVRTEFTESHHRFDQCGVVLYLDSENWLKGSVEYENERFQHLGSVVTNHGYSDWATTEIPANVKTMWYRLSRRGERLLHRVLSGRGGVPANAHLSFARSAGGNPLRHLCLQPRGFFLPRCLYENGANRMPVAGT